MDTRTKTTVADIGHTFARERFEVWYEWEGRWITHPPGFKTLEAAREHIRTSRRGSAVAGISYVPGNADSTFRIVRASTICETIE